MKRIIILVTIGVFLLSSCASRRTKTEQTTETTKDSVKTVTSSLNASEVVTQMTATFTGGEPLIIDTPKGRTKISGSGNVTIEQTSTNTDVNAQTEERVRVETKIEFREKIVESKGWLRWWYLLIAFCAGWLIGRYVKV
jgi:PBP1b-binding outer membrane lipoprotein LpoB